MNNLFIDPQDNLEEDSQATVHDIVVEVEVIWERQGPVKMEVSGLIALMREIRSKQCWSLWSM